MSTTAEGVETQQQLDQLRAFGCNEIQGFVFAKPCPAPEVARFFKPAPRLALSA
jgi:EAL domain-containing protein (putative c-di-GMP-specific phosphodiesterase class I)